MNKRKSIATMVVFFVILWGFLLGFLLLPDAALSYTERRKLEQLPKPTVESILSTEYMKSLEQYAQDQFPLREELRAMKAQLQYQVLRQGDSKGIYLANGSAIKMEATLKPEEVLFCADKINALYETYLQGMNVYCAVIPDKNYFAAEEFQHLSYDYGRMMTLFTQRLSQVQYVDLFGSLSLSDYYLSDAHWRQEALGPVRDTLAKAMGIQDRLPDLETYARQELYPFQGVYVGQSALPVEADRLVYLTNPVLDQATVRSAEQEGSLLSVYAPEKLTGMDGYDVFLHGAQAIITMENPLATTDKELILFRDSFGSSLAPLFLDAYKKVTLIDLRYVASPYLGDFVEFSDQDVLFLYSTGIVNSGRLLR